MLDVPVLLAAVSPDSPCGDDLEYDAAFLELERIAQGQPERQMGDAVLPAEPPEWPRVRALASELFGRSKDLRVANLLLQSNVALDGLDGLAEGLLLVRELLGQYWDGVYPLLDADDDNDPTFRINALTGLVAEPLLQLVWAIPLVRSRAFGPVNLRAAQYYVRHEPSSPVPVLLKRAKTLVTADFAEIVRNLIPDGISQFETLRGPESE